MYKESPFLKCVRPAIHLLKNCSRDTVCLVWNLNRISAKTMRLFQCAFYLSKGTWYLLFCREMLARKDNRTWRLNCRIDVIAMSVVLSNIWWSFSSIKQVHKKIIFCDLVIVSDCKSEWMWMTYLISLLINFKWQFRIKTLLGRPDLWMAL